MPTSGGRGLTVLFVGNLVAVKRPELAIKAFASYLRQTNEGDGCKAGECVGMPRLLILGDGPLRGRMTRLCSELGIASRVHFLGVRPHGEIALWMNVADALCLTSRSEGMPNVVIEALVSGLPVVVSDVGACREMVADESLARVIRSGDAEESEFANAFEVLSSVGSDRRAMSEKHANRFSWRRQASGILDLLDAGSVS